MAAGFRPATGNGRASGNGSQGFSDIPGFGAPRAEAGNADTYVEGLGQDAILRAYQAGLGVLISKTSDGGALSVTIYDGDNRHRSYAGNQDEAISLWEAVMAFAQSKLTPPTAGPSRVPGQPAQANKGTRARR